MPRFVSVRRRVAVGVAVMLLPLLVVAGASTWALVTTLGLFGQSTNQAVDHALPVTRLQTLVIRLERAGLEAARGGNPAATERYAVTRREMDDAFRRLERRGMDAEAHLVANARGHSDRIVHLLDQAIAAGEADPRVSDPPAAADLVLFTEIRHRTDAAAGSLRAAEVVSDEAIRHEYERARRLQEKAVAINVTVMLAGLLVALVGGLSLARAIVGPIRVLQEAVRRLGNGVLSHRVVLDRHDEFAELGEALNAMAAALGRSQTQLTHQALHDALTGLPNRALLNERIRLAVRRGSRRRSPSALLLIDLDGFKAVNDTLGHGVGDVILRTAADRLRSCLRPEDTAARLGGDEFAVLVHGTVDQALPIAERILAAMRPGFPHAGQELFVTASIGIAVAGPGSPVSAEELLRNADLAMYRAKQGGKDGACLFDRSMHDSARDRLRLDRDLRAALRRGELTLRYQPIYDMQCHAVLGVEALLRWDHPSRGPIAPSEFIPVAESSGTIRQLGGWALGEACRQLRQWQQDATSPEAARRAGELELSVNLSPRQLADSELPALVADALARHDIAPDRLTLEITESVMVADVPGTIRQLRRLKAVGVKLAIDDFGTGYSSLGYLQQFPVDRVKIDQAFVRRLGTPKGTALVEGIVNLARALSLEPVAEGVEDQPQVAALLSLGCRLGQGFHLAEPRTPDEMAGTLEAAGQGPEDAVLRLVPTPRRAALAR